MKEKNQIWNAAKVAFPHTIPIMTGYGFLGMAYGICMRVAGLPAWYPMLSSIIVFGGSLEFLLVTMLLAPFAPVQTLIMTILVQARHLFYGIAMLDRYKGLGWKRFYLIFGLTDETFSINCTAKTADNVDRGWFYFFVTLFDQSYWVLASTTGGLIGSLLPSNTTGLDFAMTAMFVVILLEQWLKDKRHISAWIGMICSVGCLLIFGADSFLIPTMCCILIGLTVFRKPIEQGRDAV